MLNVYLRIEIALSVHDQNQFVEMFLKNQDKIFRYIASYVPNRVEADDVFQQTSMILWKKRDRFETDQSFLNWAFGIARNELRNHFRKSSKNSHMRLSYELLAMLAEERVSHQDELELRKQALGYCMAQLPDAKRKMIEGYYSSKQTIREYSKGIGSTPSAVYKGLSRIRASLMACVKRRIAMELRHG